MTLLLTTVVQASADRRVIQFIFDPSHSYAVDRSLFPDSVNMILGRLGRNDSYSVDTIRDCAHRDYDETLEMPLTRKRYSSRTQELLWLAKEELGVADFFAGLKETETSDIYGAIDKAGLIFLQQPSTRKYLVVFSDMQPQPRRGCDGRAAIASRLDGVEIFVVGIERTRTIHASEIQHWQAAWLDYLKSRGAARVAFVDDVDEICMSIWLEPCHDGLR